MTTNQAIDWVMDNADDYDWEDVEGTLKEMGKYKADGSVASTSRQNSWNNNIVPNIKEDIQTKLNDVETKFQSTLNDATTETEVDTVDKPDTFKKASRWDDMITSRKGELAKEINQEVLDEIKEDIADAESKGEPIETLTMAEVERRSNIKTRNEASRLVAEAGQRIASAVEKFESSIMEEIRSAETKGDLDDIDLSDAPTTRIAERLESEIARRKSGLPEET